MITEESKESQFEEDLYIDPTALDIEWLSQPNTFLKYTEKLAKAGREKDRCDQAVKVAQARIRKKLNDAGGKVTESAIEEELRSTPEWNNYLDAKYEENLLDGAVKAFYQRKEALENLVRLQGQNYFAVPKEPRNLGAEYEKKLKQDAARKRMAEASITKYNKGGTV
jgi:Recombination, repair and ssDNA binding protein UvsY